MQKMKLILALIIYYFITSCDNTSQELDKIFDESTNESSNTTAIAIPIYNQAYQENFAADAIVDIVANAKNGYVLLDPFEDNISESISLIKANSNEVGAYISIGTGERYRDDYEELKPYLVSKPWGEWPDEFFVNNTTSGILEVMKRRIDKIATWGYDWVEFDNMDWAYDDNNRSTYGFQVSEEEGIAYFQALCDYVHKKGMKCMAKNMTDNASDFDGVLYESYNTEKNWWDQSGAKLFMEAGKLVIVNHYNESDCNKVYADYTDIYTSNLSFICEDTNLKKYVHYNQQ